MVLGRLLLLGVVFVRGAELSWGTKAAVWQLGEPCVNSLIAISFPINFCQLLMASSRQNEEIIQTMCNIAQQQQYTLLYQDIFGGF